MIGIVIVAHGGLAAEYRAAMEHVVGAQDNVKTVRIAADYDRSQKTAEIAAAMDAVDTGRGVVLITDLFGSSPSNLCVHVSDTDDRQVIYGANVPLLVKLAKSRNKPVAQAVQASILAGRKYLDCVPTCKDRPVT